MLPSNARRRSSQHCHPLSAPWADVHNVLKQVRLDCLQFHGEESPQSCRGFDIPYIKVIRVREGLDIVEYAGRYPDACGLLLDTYHKEIPGGTGDSFDWSRVPKELKRPIILAGGLTADNVARAIAALHPYGVDVSSGIEASGGIKDPDKMTAFINSVQNT